MALVAPEECREIETVSRAIDSLVGSGNSPISEVHFFDVRESMRNGGGPACLRLRTALTDEEVAAVHPGAWLTPDRERELREWIGKNYRDRLEFDDLRDPKLYFEIQSAMDSLEGILGFPLA